MEHVQDNATKPNIAECLYFNVAHESPCDISNYISCTQSIDVSIAGSAFIYGANLLQNALMTTNMYSNPATYLLQVIECHTAPSLLQHTEQTNNNMHTEAGVLLISEMMQHTGICSLVAKLATANMTDVFQRSP